MAYLLINNNYSYYYNNIYLRKLQLLFALLFRLFFVRRRAGTAMEKFVEGLDAFTQRLGRSQTEEAGPALHFELEFLKIDGFIERLVDLTCAAADLRAEME